MKLASQRTLLVLTSTYPRWAGDAEPGFVHELARRLTTRFRVLVLCPHARGARDFENLDGVSIQRFRYGPDFFESLVNNGGVVTNLRRHPWKWLLVPGFVLMQGFEAWRICRREDVDVVHAHWLIPQGIIAGLLFCLPGSKVPFVVTSHGADLHTLKSGFVNWFKRWVLSIAPVATVVSKAMLDMAISIGADEKKVLVRPMGVNMREGFIPEGGQLRSTNELLFVGRLVEKKGLSYLLDALWLILKEKPDITLTIAGFGPDEERLKQKVVSLGMQEAVRFVGAVPQSELPNLYRRAALFVAPFVQAATGDQEGLGLVLIEAIACGCPVVSGNVDAVNDVLGPDAAVCVVDARDHVRLADVVLEKLSQPRLIREQALAMRERLINKFDWEVVSEAYADTLTAVCK